MKTPPRLAGAADFSALGTGSVRRQAGHLFLHPQFLFLEPGERGRVRQGALAFLEDFRFEPGMLGLESRNVRLVHSHLLHG
jgi:hypothetical protein